ncbi:MAG: CoA transferase [Pseudomonadota bacterium]
MKPLSDLTVTERGDGVGIRYAGRLLAQLGAAVWRPDGPGPTGIGYDGEAGAAYAAWLDQDKKVGSPPSADLVIAEQGTVDHFEAEFVAVLSWFSPGGTYSGWQGSDAIIQALSGHVYPFGPTDGPPAIQQGETPQIIAAVTLCIAVLAGLIGRREGNGPDRVDVNVLEAAMCLSEVVPMVYASTGVVAGRRGINRFFPTFPGNCWQASDGWVGITTVTPPQWQTLCELCDHPEMATDPAFATTELRIGQADLIDARFSPKIRERPVDYWVSQGQAQKLPFVAVLRPGDLAADPHWKARGTFVEANGLKAPRAPFRITQGRTGRTHTVTPTARKPLSGLQVMDLSMGWSGPLATRHLGAHIVKVESKAHPDWWRGWNGPTGDPLDVERRRDFAGMNTNKHDILLDLTDPDEFAMAKRLAQGSDVLIENYATGVIDKLGLGHASLQHFAPGIVSVSMALFGAAGPNATFRGYGSTTDQASGLPFMNGDADWPPVQCHIALGDAIAGLFAAVGALAGVFGRAKFGGAYIDLSQIETLFQLSAPAILAEQVTGQPVPRHRMSRPSSAFTWIGACRGEDDWLVIDCVTKDHRASLVALIGDTPDFCGSLSDWAERRSAQEAAALLQSNGIPAAPVQQQHLLDKDRHLLDTGFWATIHRPVIGEHLITNPPYRLDGERPAIDRAAPVMGQHDGEIRANLCDERATV